MRAFVDDKAFFPGFGGTVGECRAIKTGTDNEVVEMIHNRQYSFLNDFLYFGQSLFQGFDFPFELYATVFFLQNALA